MRWRRTWQATPSHRISHGRPFATNDHPSKNFFECVHYAQAPAGFLAALSKQEGYWFWSEFIAESISLYVEERYHSIDRSEHYHLELITWEPEMWGRIADKLLDFLEMAFNTIPRR